VRELKKSSWSAALAVLLVAATMPACNLTKRLSAKKEAPVRHCFNQSTAAAASTESNEAANNATARNNSGQQWADHQQAGRLLSSTDGGFSIKLPAGFPPPDPPEPMQPGYQYAGITYRSYLSGCRCRLNYTAITATAASGESDEKVLADRRELVSRDLVGDKYQPAKIDRTEESRVQNHPALTVDVSGVGVNDRPEYRRYKFIVARGHVYTIEFAAEDEAERDHPEVNAFFDSFQFIDELDQQVISKPAPEYPVIARARHSQGTVTVEVTVNKDGQVTDARVVTGPIDLQSAAKAAALKARFPPGKSEVKGTLTYNFSGT
jgi:TonB family protein